MHQPILDLLYSNLYIRKVVLSNTNLYKGIRLTLTMGTYTEQHNKDQCDKCLKEIGINNLNAVPFLYKDMNDDKHKDMGDGYRQYYVCEKCIKPMRY